MGMSLEGQQIIFLNLALIAGSSVIIVFVSYLSFLSVACYAAMAVRQIIRT